MSSLLRMVVCLSGVVLILTVIRDPVQKKLKDTVFVLAGDSGGLDSPRPFSRVTGWFAGLFGVEYGPAAFSSHPSCPYTIYRRYRANASLSALVSCQCRYPC